MGADESRKGGNLVLKLERETVPMEVLERGGPHKLMTGPRDDQFEWCSDWRT